MTSSNILKVISACDYLTDTDNPWRQADYNASKMVKALKGDEIKGYFDVKIGGVSRRFDQSNVHVFVEKLPRALGGILSRYFPGDVTLVPIPNSSVTATEDAEFRTLKFAKAIAEAATGNVTVCPALVFKSPQPKSRNQGGSRDPYYLEEVMRVVERPEGPVVLVDDVYTTGAHLVAATWKLSAHDVGVTGAMAFGRSTKVQRPNPFEIFTYELDIDRLSGLPEF